MDAHTAAEDPPPSSTNPTNLRVGLTGGIASGKSTVGRMMAEAGCTVTDADRLVASLYRPGNAGADAVHELFGAEFLATDGSVDKQKLAALVFGDERQRKRLEQVIHPLVGIAFAELVEVTSGVVVFEATLLVEGGRSGTFERLVTVEADPDLRLRRAVDRGLAESEALARMEAQTDEATRSAAADYVIRNEAGLNDLRQATADTVEQLRRDLQRKNHQDD